MEWPRATSLNGKQTKAPECRCGGGAAAHTECLGCRSSAPLQQALNAILNVFFSSASLRADVSSSWVSQSPCTVVMVMMQRARTWELGPPVSPAAALAAALAAARTVACCASGGQSPSSSSSLTLAKPANEGEGKGRK